MVKVVNFTPFANLRFSNRNPAGKEFGVFMAKTAWDIEPDGSCTLSSEQEPFIFTDTYHGELNVSALRYPSDFVPYKPHSDVIFDATAYAPGGKPAAEWLVSVKVTDELGTFAASELLVTGPRQWRPVWLTQLKEEQKFDWRRHRGLFRGWELSQPNLIGQLPIRYEYAFGGRVAKGLDEDGLPVLEAFEHNPIGRGLIDQEFTDHTHPVDAPQILIRNAALADPYAEQAVGGFGPIPPAWLPRRPFGGTYDDHWLENVWPEWAEDYDYRFHNSAHPSIRGSRYLKGAVTIELHNLFPDKPDFSIRIPASRPVAVTTMKDGSNRMLEMARDTVFLEISERFRDDPRIYCVWRTPFDMLETEGLSLLWANPEQAARLECERLEPDQVARDPALLDPDAEVERA
ncbi:DUF2169 family type VI secretion system accessory protein [Neorhizobium sp. DT-125]|uniref:DUF2169 family type VI secretion system accessory protein n=1 Tax=Neorhizobium sp. DT-125 TaxID=3396163 RepID=UPI003F1D01D3